MEKMEMISDKVMEVIDRKAVDQAQFTVSETETKEITMERGAFTLFRTLFDQNLYVEVLKDQKRGTTNINKMDDESIESAVDTAILSAKSGMADENYEIAKEKIEGTFTLGVVEPDVEKLMMRSQELANDIASRHPQILVMQTIITHKKVHYIYQNTSGSKDELFSGQYTIMIEFAGNDGTNSTGISETYFGTDNLDRPFIEMGSVERALKDAEDSLQTTPMTGKFEGTVIFTPECTAQMIAMALGNFAGGGAILENTSLWKDKMGEQVADERLTISMKPWDERIIEHEVHTEDGFRSENYDLIDHGVLKSFMTSLYVSNKCKVDRAANSSMNLVIEGGDTPYETMVKNVDKGLIVGAFSGGQPGANGEFSGVAKNSFYVEDGKIIGAVTETMINGNLADMLKNVVAISKETLCDGNMVVPYIGFDHIVISGK